jgi:hypothetical protein
MSVKHLLMILSSALPLVASVALAASAMNSEELVGLAQRADAWKAKDEFDAAPDYSGNISRPFKVLLPISSSSNGASWGYNPESRVLSISNNVFPFALGPIWNRRGLNGTGMFIYGLRLSSSESPPEKYIGSTPLGVNANVSLIRQNNYGLTDIDKSSDQTMPALVGREVKLNLGPDEARIITRSLRYEVEGELQPFDGNRLIMCGLDVKKPSLDSPSEVRRRFCVVSVRVNRVAFVNSASGEILKEWVRVPRRSDGGYLSPTAEPPTGREWSIGGGGDLVLEPPVSLAGGTPEGLRTLADAAKEFAETASGQSVVLHNLTVHRSVFGTTTVCADALYGDRGAGFFIGQARRPNPAFRLNGTPAEAIAAGCDGEGIRLPD